MRCKEHAENDMVGAIENPITDERVPAGWPTAR
jgi:hypothetical protein